MLSSVFLKTCWRIPGNTACKLLGRAFWSAWSSKLCGTKREGSWADEDCTSSGGAELLISPLVLATKPWCASLWTSGRLEEVSEPGEESRWQS